MISSDDGGLASHRTSKYNFCHIESALLTGEVYVSQKTMCIKPWIVNFKMYAEFNFMDHFICLFDNWWITMSYCTYRQSTCGINAFSLFKRLYSEALKKLFIHHLPWEKDCLKCCCLIINNWNIACHLTAEDFGWYGASSVTCCISFHKTHHEQK